MRTAHFLLSLATALAVVARVSAGPTSDCTSNAGWSITTAEHYYDATNVVTVFEYEVTADAESGDLSHFTISAPGCTGVDLVEVDDWVAVGEGAEFGYRRIFGVKAGTSETVTITLDGEHAYGAVTASLRGAECSDEAAVVGPVCSDSPVYGEPCVEGWEGTIEGVECDSEELDALLQAAAVNRTIDGPTDGCDANRVITRVAWDNYAECRQEIHVVDTTAPVISLPEGVNETVDVDCAALVPGPANVTAVDACGDATVNLCTDEIAGRCPNNKFITYTWKAVDECGNEDCITQTLIIEDTTAPVLSDRPEDPEPFECPKDISDFDIAVPITATDDCDAEATSVAAFTQEVLWGDCAGEYAVVREWSAEDSCGNKASHRQHIVVRDTTPPVWGGEFDAVVPSTVECTLPDSPNITALDACSGEIEVDFVETPTSGSCPQEKFYTWTYNACDDCGNAAQEIRHTITVVDTTAPTFDLAAESDVTVECDSVPPQRAENITDTCDPTALLATCVETRTNTSCENQYTLSRNCTATDACGNSVSRVRTITVIDESITCPTAPADVTVSCNAIPSFDDLTIPEQACSADVTQSKAQTGGPEADSCNYDLVRTWSFVDCADNPCSVQQTVTVVDDVEPTFDQTMPADTSAFCNAPAGDDSLTASDDCQGTLAVTHSDETATECPGREVVTRTYTATDGCGNSVTHPQTITVYDNTAPTWTTFPDNVTLNCDDEVSVETPTADDDCSSATVIMVSDVTPPTDCSNAYVRTITWYAVDSCGNRTPDRAQKITVQDPQAPSLTEPLPEDTTEVCSDISCPADVTATDNCDGLNLTYVQTRVEVDTPTCEELYKLQRTWTATDACGETDVHVQTITVEDPEAPVYQGDMSELEDMFVSCEDNIEDMLPTAPETEWTDNCGDVTFVGRTNRTTPSMQCPTNVTVTFTWTVRDECGNEASVSKAIHVYDTTNPTVEDLGDVTFECDAEVVLDTPEHSDSCANTALTVGSEDTTLDCLVDGYLSQTVRTFTVVDKCGNEATSTQTVYIDDTTAPSMTCPDEVITATCCEVPEPVKLVATDNCAADQEVTAVTTRQNGSCVNTYNLTHTWTATDACGNSATCSQVVVVEDNTFPTLEGVPETDQSASCESIPKPEQVCASDDCGPITIEFSERRSGDDECNSKFVLTRTWKAIDACGHETEAAYNLTVTDDVDPVWTTEPLPSGGQTECVAGAAAPTIAAPTCEDSCTTASVTPSTSFDDSDICNVSYSFGWACADECQNTITHNTTAYVVDTTDPFFTWGPGGAPAASVAFDCAADTPATPGVGDACTTATLSTDFMSNLVVNDSCPIQRTWTRVWNVTDQCGHLVMHTQDVEIRRPGVPTFNTTASDVTIECDDGIPEAPMVGATDACDSELVVLFDESIENEMCTEVSATASEYDIVRTWNATDSCGQFIELTQVIRVRDAAPPVLTVPAARTQHNKCAQAPKLTGESATDDCNAVETSCAEEDLNAVRTCPYLWDMNYTFTATDNCGKTDVGSVRETYTYDLKPYVVGGDEIVTMRMASCDNVDTTPDEIQWADGCGANITGGSVTPTTLPGDCPNEYTLVWTYAITDDCGQSAEFVIRTKVVDDKKPTLQFEWPLQDETVECPFVAPAPLATATDSCGGNVTIEFSEFKEGFDETEEDCCNYKVYRFWTATDACGLFTTATQTITVVDTIPPQWTGPDIGPRDVSCPTEVPRPAIQWFEAPVAHGFCPAVPETTDCSTAADADTFVLRIGGVDHALSDARFVRWVNGFAFVTGVATPESGGGNPLAVNFQFNRGNVSNADGLAQAINSDTLEASCYNGSDGTVLAQWKFYEELQGNLTDTMTGDLIEVTGVSYAQLGLGATGRNELYGLRTTLSAGGEAGELVLQLDACDTESWGLPELECGVELETGENMTYTETCPGTYVLTYIWFAEDTAGNMNRTEMVVTSTDLTAPVFTVQPPSSATAKCEDPAIPQVNATDECSNATVTRTDSTPVPLGRNCDHHYTFVRTWTAVDECGNNATAEQNVTVEDDVDPTITLEGKPDNLTVECWADLPAAANATCTDNCGEANIASCEASDSDPTPSNCNTPVTYTYNAEDNCGNTAMESYTVTVNDIRPPVCDNTTAAGGVCGTASTRVSCADPEPAKLAAVFVDNCDGALTVMPVRTRSGSCPETIVDTYNVADSCNHSASTFTRTYVIYDDVPPTLTLPANRTVTDCADRLSPTAAEEIASGAVSASDACGDATVTLVSEVDVKDGDCLVRVERTWLATDACGLTATGTSYIIVDDQTPPTFSPPMIDDLTLGCNDEIPCPETVTITDNCDNVRLEFDETSVTDPTCAHDRVITRTWTATDACGKVSTLVYSIFISDTGGPVWDEGLPENATYECDAVLPNSADDVSATDECGDVTISYSGGAPESGGCPANYTLVRTWTATDDCENSIEHNITVEVVDTTAPSAMAPADKTFECGVAFPGFDVPTFTDACDAEVDVTSSDATEPVPLACPGNYTTTRTWTGTDDCGNSFSVSQSVTSEDTTAPTLAQPEREYTSECVAAPPATPPAGSDDCTPQKDLVPGSGETATSDSEECAWPFTVERNWSVTDQCGHTTTVYQTEHVVDSDAPVLTFTDGEPQDFTTECTMTVAWPEVSANDDCQGAIAVDTSKSTPRDPLSVCDTTETRVWEACDCTGNCANHTQVIRYEDTTPPAFTEVPTGGPFACDVDPVYPNATAVDSDCTGATLEVEPAFVRRVNGMCDWNYTIVMQYVATDDCGNSATVTVDFEFEDSDAPVIGGDFANVTVECGEAPPDAGFTCSDACDGDGSAFGLTEGREDTELDDGDECENTRLVLETYTCTDTCGNTASETRYVRYEDTTPPTIDEGTLPANRYIECGSGLLPDEGDIVAPDLTSPAQFGSISDAISGSGDCSSQSGGFGFTAFDWADFNIDPESDPMWQMFNEGLGIDQYIKFTGDIVSSDDSDVRFEFSIKASGYSGPTFAPCDDGRDEFVPPTGHCGPHLEFPYSGSAEYEVCYGSGSAANPDNWEQYSRIDYGYLYGVGKCAGAQVRITARGPPPQIGVGANGRSLNFGSSFWFQWVRTNEAVVPADCPIPSGAHAGDVNIDMQIWDGSIIVPDDCPDNATITSNTETVSGNCPANYTEITTWTITDCVGLNDSATRVVQYGDSLPPVISNFDLPSTLECDAQLPAVSPVGTDLCDGDVFVSGPNQVSETGDSCVATRVYEFTAADECGNNASVTDSVVVSDTTAPVFESENSTITYECDEVRRVTTDADYTATDNCNSVSYTLENTTESGLCADNFTVTWVWTAEDTCGNSAQLQEVHVVSDNTPPVITTGDPQCLADSTESIFWKLEDVTVNGVYFSATDNCDDTPTITITGCSSDQDEDQGAEPTDPGFTTHCFYNADEDALYVRRSINNTILEGRLYTITAEAEDNCGLTDSVDRQLLIANGLAENTGDGSPSWVRRNITVEDDTDCFAAKYCVHMCPPCVYDVSFCPEDNEAVEQTISLDEGASGYDSETDSTVFVYSVSAGASRVTLGLNLAQAEVLEISGDSDEGQRFGFNRDSYFSGISWTDADISGDSISLRLRGDWTSDEDNTAFQIKWEDEDDQLTRISSVRGPCKRDSDGVEASISGTIGVSGTVYGDRAASPQLPLGGVVVKLMTKSVHSPVTLAYTATAADGTYTFTNLDESAEYQVVIDEEGFLEGSLQGAHRYLTTDTNALVHQYGEPRCIPSVPATDADIGILIDELKWDTLADRARYLEPSMPVEILRGRIDETDTNFNGNSKSVSFWTEQYFLLNMDHTSQMLIDESRFAVYTTLADAKLASFGASAEDLLTTGTEYQQRVAALALNHASGYGVFRPFRELQGLILDYAVAVGPAPATEAVVSAMVLKMLSAN